MPLLKMKQALHKLSANETLLVKASDPGSLRDFEAYIKLTPHHMTHELRDGVYLYLITKVEQ